MIQSKLLQEELNKAVTKVLKSFDVPKKNINTLVTGCITIDCEDEQKDQLIKALKSILAVNQKAVDNQGYYETPGIWCDFADALKEARIALEEVEEVGR